MLTGSPAFVDLVVRGGGALDLFETKPCLQTKESGIIACTCTKIIRVGCKGSSGTPCDNCTCVRSFLSQRFNNWDYFVMG